MIVLDYHDSRRALAERVYRYGEPAATALDSIKPDRAREHCLGAVDSILDAAGRFGFS